MFDYCRDNQEITVIFFNVREPYGDKGETVPDISAETASDRDQRLAQIVEHAFEGEKIYHESVNSQQILFLSRNITDEELTQIVKRIAKETSVKMRYAGISGIHMADPNIFDIVGMTLTCCKKIMQIAEQANRDILLSSQVKKSLPKEALIEGLRFFIELERLHAFTVKDYERQGRIDQVTYFYNRRGFDALFEMSVERAKRYGNPIAFLYADTDSLKMINDKYGHVAGDQFIIAISKIMKRETRKSDVLSRWGGDEFAIILDNISFEDSKRTAERLRKAIEEETIGTISIGIYYGIPDTPDEALLIADEAMYKVKNNGKNSVIAINNSSVNSETETPDDSLKD